MQSTLALSMAVGLAVAGAIPPVHHAASVAAPQDAGLGPFHFTSTYNLIATPERVVDAESVSAPGEAGAMGFYNYGINSELDIICYNITLMGVTGPYDSPAVTATHIHEAAEGQAGPPRIAFPNPEPADSGPEVIKRSAGCLQGPFTTGIDADDGSDTGAGFTLAQIEANPNGFFTDSHTMVSVPGVVRAQLEVGAGGAGGVAGAAPGSLLPGHGTAPSNPGGCTVQVVAGGLPVTIVCK
ncbi:hypothetical protein CC79DRAFT_1351902 [Sarocladium strictum]